jgi:Family of unknown function (DUF6515)
MKYKLCKYGNFNNLTLMGIILLSFLIISTINAQARRGHVVVRKRVVRVEHLPPHYETIVIHKKNYFYNNGFFYRRGPRGYSIIRAPIGARLRVLPVGYTIVKFGGLSYYYFNGAYYYYVPAENVYVVVEKPADAVNTPENKFDQVKLYDGSTVEGVFQSATDSTISIEVKDEIQEIPINNIISITFASSISEDN